MSVPTWLLVHTVTVTPRTGSGAYGTTYGDPFTLRCFRETGHKLVRAADGNEVVSSAQLYAAPGQAASIPAGSTVEWDGHTTTVVASHDRDSGGLGAPDHTEVVCE